MSTKHTNPLVAEFLQRSCRATLSQFSKADLVDLAVHLGWEKPEQIPKKADLRVIVEGLAVAAGILEAEKVKSSGVKLPGVEKLSFEQYMQLEKEKASIERERWQFQLEHEKLRAEQAQKAREAEGQVALERERLKLEQLKLELIREGKASEVLLGSGTTRQSLGGCVGFDVAGNLRLLPKFNERDPDTFFSLFERVAVTRGWPDADRTLLLQCVFTGKAQEAYSALSPVDSMDYVKVKAAVLKAYELVPEAYRQRFRTWRKGDKQTHVEFARDIAAHFARWCSASAVDNYDDLCDLIVLEQFKDSVPNHIAVHINESKVKTASAAAVLADEYVLTHASSSEWRRSGNGTHRDTVKSGLGKFVGAHQGAQASVRSVPGTDGKFDPGKVCHSCRNKGHWKGECPIRVNVSADQKLESSVYVKPTALVSSVPNKVFF